MLLSDNFYSFTLFIDYKRPLKLTHLRLGDDTVSADGNMKSQEEPAVCVTEEDEPTTLDDSRDGHDGHMAGRR